MPKISNSLPATASLSKADALTGPRLSVDLAALRYNYNYLSDKIKPTICAAVVKADAYGLGMVKVAETLAAEGCKTFFVAWLEEGIELRQALPDTEIIVLHGPAPGAMPAFAEYNLIPTFNHLGQLAEIANYAAKIKATVKAVGHVDSGLNRLGMPKAEIEKLAATPDLLSGIELRLWMSHLAIPALPNHPTNREQLKNFNYALSVLPKAPASLAASSGSFLGQEYLFDMVRIGSSIYGMNPHPPKANPLKAVLYLEFPVLQIQEVPIGGTVGYGCTWTAERPSRIATLGGGFADGYQRSLSNSGTVWIGQHKVPVAGRVSMDLITIDITDLPPHLMQVGQPVAILNEHYTVNHLAGEAKTRVTEILCYLGRKHKRRYINE
ncbi:MAG: alanine racemase [Dongiaceae bacterium]